MQNQYMQTSKNAKIANDQAWQMRSRHTGEIFPCIYKSFEEAWRYKSPNDFEIMNVKMDFNMIQEYYELIENHNMDSLDWMQLLFDLERLVGDNCDFQHLEFDKLIQRISMQYPEQYESFKNEANETLKKNMIRIMNN